MHARINTGRLTERGEMGYDWQRKQRMYEFGPWAERNSVALNQTLNSDFAAA